MAKAEYLSEEQRKISDNKKRIRTKIANTVRRNNIDKKCFNCGEEGRILYDFNNPYNVVFICSKCKSDKEILERAEKYKIDIKELIKTKINNSLGTNDLVNRQIRWIDDKNVKIIIDNFLESSMTLGKYIKSLGISRHQFYGIVERYNRYLPNGKTINKEIKLKMNKVQKDNVIVMKQKIKR